MLLIQQYVIKHILPKRIRCFVVYLWTESTLVTFLQHLARLSNLAAHESFFSPPPPPLTFDPPFVSLNDFMTFHYGVMPSSQCAKLLLR